MQAATRLRDGSVRGIDRATGAERALAEVEDFLKNQRVRWKDEKGGFGEFERGLHAHVMAFERELLAEEVQAADVASFERRRDTSAALELNGQRGFLPRTDGRRGSGSSQAPSRPLGARRLVRARAPPTGTAGGTANRPNWFANHLADRLKRSRTSRPARRRARWPVALTGTRAPPRSPRHPPAHWQDARSAARHGACYGWAA
jgi:hypothetical protein